MRIAQIAPLFESVPPRLYGGTERVVSYLVEELVRQGHRVTLFASADSITSAELVPAAARALRGASNDSTSCEQHPTDPDIKNAREQSKAFAVEHIYTA